MNDTNAQISVCIPTYNNGHFLVETLKSIQDQTYRNIEIIISDNASTDNTRQIVEEFQKEDDRILYSRNSENIGYSQNILKAVKSASGEIVAIFHSDDIYHKDIIEKELSLLRSDQEIDGVFSFPAVFSNDPSNAVFKNFYKNLKYRKQYDEQKNAIIGDYSDFLPLLLESGNIFACPSFMTKKSVFLKHGGFNDNYPSNEDLDLWISYLQSGSKLGIINEFLLYYRMSGINASSYWQRKPELAVMYKVLEERIINNQNLSNEEMKLFSRNKAIGYARASVNAVYCKDRSTAKALSKQSKDEYSFKLFSVWGIIQFNPFLATKLKDIIEKIRNR